MLRSPGNLSGMHALSFTFTITLVHLHPDRLGTPSSYNTLNVPSYQMSIQQQKPETFLLQQLLTEQENYSFTQWGVWIHSRNSLSAFSKSQRNSPVVTPSKGLSQGCDIVTSFSNLLSSLIFLKNHSSKTKIAFSKVYFYFLIFIFIYLNLFHCLSLLLLHPGPSI